MDPALKEYLDKLNVFILPVSNPDGAHAAFHDSSVQRKNLTNYCGPADSDPARRNSWGVDVNRKYEHGLTALMWAAGYADGAGVDDIEGVVALLIAHGAALDTRDDRGKTALDIARDLGHPEIADHLAAQSTAR